jgi:hypothetical protein
MPIGLTADHFSTVHEILKVHPSEATTLLAAALDGIRGTIEIRDSGTQLQLTTQSAHTFLLPSGLAAKINPLARALADSRSLEQASATTKDLCGRSELDYERRKAAGPARDRPSVVDEREMSYRIRRYADSAVSQGVTAAPFRRLIDAVHVRTYDPALLRTSLGDAAHPWLPLAFLDRYLSHSTTSGITRTVRPT